MLRFLIALTLLGGASLFAEPVADLMVFDEDDPLGRDYYDASIGSASGKSALKLLASSRDKMPVVTNSAASGRFSGSIEWISRSDGNWKMHIFRPGFPQLNLTNHQMISFALNAPEEMASSALPRLELHDVRNRIRVRPLAELIAGGIDGDRATWQRFIIPISALRGDSAFEMERVKHVTLAQAAADATERKLWIDDFRFQSNERLVITTPPSAAAGVAGRIGDKSVTLRWNAVESLVPIRYRVYRREAVNEEFTELSQSPVTSTSIADVQVENGKAYFYVVRAENEAGLGGASVELKLTPRAFGSDEDFLDYVQGTAFDYFWCEANSKNGMIRDRSQPWSAASIAAIGFGLTGITIGIDRQWITREEGAERVWRTLSTLWNTPQSAADSGTSGHKGWFYHFLKMEDGTRYGTSELSSIDTALLLAGVLDSAEYFKGNNHVEGRIRSLARQIYDRLDWNWMLNEGETLSMGWHPEQGFLRARWEGYNEASILYILGLGARESNRLDRKHWDAWTKTYTWGTSFGYSFIHFAPLFGHQYTACWIDFRNIADDYTAAKGITYFENSRRATLAQREYCIANPSNFPGYGPDIWGLTACDGPGSNGAHSYIARGAPPAENDDGTIAPTAPGGSLPFAPKECLEALKTMYDRYRERIWCGYGFRDAFNLKENWWGEDVIGIDQGAILVMAENLRTGGVWQRMKGNEALQGGMKRAGFRPFRSETPSSK